MSVSKSLARRRARLSQPSTFEQRGELAAAVELRRPFPGVTDSEQARECDLTIAGCEPLSVMPPSSGLRSSKTR
jgi:hypothetical protein